MRNAFEMKDMWSMVCRCEDVSVIQMSVKEGVELSLASNLSRAG